MIVKALRPVTKMITGAGSTTRKKKFKYQVKLRGTRISKHYTKKQAEIKARSIRGAKVVPYRVR